jgi:hypothetical protein
VNIGLLISLSVLIAAGLAVYENPQVRQWVDTSRRKIAVALHSLGDEIGPRSPTRNSSPDPSTRPDDSPEAVERRRRARYEILERGRVLQEKRDLQNKSCSENSKSFDDLVDKDGVLIDEKAGASTTAADPKPSTQDRDLRKRNTEAKAGALGSALANPFADEMQTELNLGTEDATHSSTTRSRTSTLNNSPVCENNGHFTPPALGIDTEIISNHPSESVVNLTPTTSASSAGHAVLREPFIPVPENRNPWSVHEWAENTSSSFFPAPQSEVSAVDHDESGFATPASDEHFSRVGAETNSDVWSEDGIRTGTPGTWTEVGSVVSDDL